jgi:hypothetical protein
MGGIELGLCHPEHVVVRAFACLNGFKRLGIFMGFGQQQAVRHAQLVEQLAATRTLRGKVNKAS